MPVNLKPTPTWRYCKKAGNFLRFYFREGWVSIISGSKIWRNQVKKGENKLKTRENLCNIFLPFQKKLYNGGLIGSVTKICHKKKAGLKKSYSQFL